MHLFCISFYFNFQQSRKTWIYFKMEVSSKNPFTWKLCNIRSGGEAENHLVSFLWMWKFKGYTGPWCAEVFPKPESLQNLHTHIIQHSFIVFPSLIHPCNSNGNCFYYTTSIAKNWVEPWLMLTPTYCPIPGAAVIVPIKIGDWSWTRGLVSRI